MIKFKISESPSKFLINFKKIFPKKLKYPAMRGVESIFIKIDDSNRFDERYKKFYRDEIFMDFYVNTASDLNLINNFLVKNFHDSNVELSINIEKIPIERTQIKKALTAEYELVKLRKFKGLRPKKVLHDIPVSELPEGIVISIRNCIRILDDAILLAENQRYRNSIVNAILAEEEFAKVIILSEYYWKRNKVPASQVKKYFGSHHYRLSELERFREESWNNETPNSFMYSFIGITAENKIFEKMLYTYVDWYDHWSDPMSHESWRIHYNHENDPNSAFLEEFLDITKPLMDYLKLVLKSDFYRKLEQQYLDN